jgi:hypothetical protein
MRWMRLNLIASNGKVKAALDLLVIVQLPLVQSQHKV